MADVPGIHAALSQAAGQIGALPKTRDIVGKAAGMSGNTYDRAKKVVEAAESDPESYGDLVEKMDETGNVSGSLREVEDRKAQRGDLPSPTSTGTRVGKGNSADKAIAKAVSSLAGIKLGLSRFQPSDVANHVDAALWAKEIGETGRFLSRFSKRLKEVAS